MKAYRYDFQRLDGITRTPSGGIRVPAALTRTGVFEYRRADGSITRELRLPEEVFHKDSMESFANAPLTIGHVPQVNPDNWGAVSVGHVIGAPKQDGHLLAGDVAVMRRDAIAKVETGELKELSCGYEVELDPTPGEWNGERYDAIQRQIRGNHVALLPEGAGRAGPDARLRTDAKDDVGFGSAYPPAVTTQSTPTHVTTATPAKDGADVLLGRLDALTAENAELKKRLDAMPAQIEAAAASRAALLARVTPLMPKGQDGQPWRADGKGEAVILREVLGALRPDVRLDGKSDDYVRGAFEEALRSSEASRQRAGSMQGPLHPLNLDGGDEDDDATGFGARSAKKKTQDAWKTPPKGALTRDSLRK